MPFETQRDLARLLRLRRENRATAMTSGLGARNVPWAQAHAGPLGADVTGYAASVPAADQAAFAQKQFAMYDRRIAELEGRAERFRNLARRSGMAGPSGLDAPLIPKAGADTLRQRLAKRGFGIESEGVKLGPVQWTRAGLQLNTAFMRSPAFQTTFAASIVGQVAAGALGTAAAAVETFKRVDDPLEASKTALATGARGFRDTVGGTFALDDLAASVATILGITPSREDARRKQAAFYDNLFTTSEELARRSKARNDALSAMYEEVNRSVGQMWATVNSTLPSSFSLRKNDLFRFRTELNRVNAVAIDALADQKKTEAARAIEAGDASGL